MAEQIAAVSGRESTVGSVGESALPLLAIGGVCGLAWAAALRGFMAQIAATDSSVTWLGTFGWILLPGVITGVLLAWAEHLRRTGGRRGWRWLALAPLSFASVLLTGLADPGSMFEGGIGGGAIGVPLVRHGGRLCAIEAWTGLGTDRLRRAVFDHDPDLGAHGDIVRRPCPCAGYRPRRLGRTVLLVPSRGLGPCLCHTS